MNPTEKNLDQCLKDVSELEKFCMALVDELPALNKLKPGENLRQHLEYRKIEVPDILGDDPIEWLGTLGDADNETEGDVITLVRPGNPRVLQARIWCVKVGRWRICLECGWFWCRIVIQRRF